MFRKKNHFLEGGHSIVVNLVCLPLHGGVTDTGPGLRFDGDTPTFGDRSIGDVAEDRDLDLGVDSPADGAVVGESDIDGFCCAHGDWGCMWEKRREVKRN